MRPNGDVHECVAVYVDDLALALKDPKSFIENPEKKDGFKLKGTGPMECHLGADFQRDPDGTSCMSPKKCITEQLSKGHQSMFGENPSTRAASPLEHGDHPELDDSDLLDNDGIEQCQSLVGSLQWTTSLGRFDAACAVMTMSAFRAAPRMVA